MEGRAFIDWKFKGTWRMIVQFFLVYSCSVGGTEKDLGTRAFGIYLSVINYLLCDYTV